jgi:hypothetical protein
MLVSFVETMRGSITDATGRPQPIEFEVKAEARSLRGFLRTGVTKVSGLLNAGPWATQVPITGTLRMSVLDRRIEYRLETGEGRSRLFLDGTKNVSPMTLLQSMTVMPVSLRDETGRTLGEGEMRFDMKDLAPFLASWLPLSRNAQRLLDVRRRQVERQALAGT